MIEIKFENINTQFLKENMNSEIKIVKNNLDFYIKLNIKEGMNNLIAFSNGAINPDKKNPPVYMRHKWGDEFNASCIFIDDRTTHDFDLKIGWGIGTPDRHYIIDYIEIIKCISEHLNIKDENIIYYGSSAGGFMSIAMATLHKGSTSIVNNPQTYIKNYSKFYVNQIYERIFPELNKVEILKKYSERFSLLNLMSKNKYVPKIIYLQNRKCKSDVINHVIPFLRNADKYKINLSNLNLIYYNDVKAGHNPLKREQTVKYVNNFIKNKDALLLK